MDQRHHDLVVNLSPRVILRQLPAEQLNTSFHAYPLPRPDQHRTLSIYDYEV
jgi:hypothetical protein